MVGDQNATDDLLQDTTLVMWRKFGEFEVGTNFTAWGIKVARFNVLKYREKQRFSRVQFSTQALEAIAAERDIFETQNNRLQALEVCVEKLPERDRAVLRMRYRGQMPIRSVAEKLGRSVQGMYKSMARIHALLERCWSTFRCHRDVHAQRASRGRLASEYLGPKAEPEGCSATRHPIIASHYLGEYE